MTQPQHTPGPWDLMEGHNAFGVEDLIKSGNWVGIRMPAPPFALGMCGALVSNMQTDIATTIANAHLIVAAPEMLKTLDACHVVFSAFFEAINGDMTDTDLASLTNATIKRVEEIRKKARGQS